jgi:hypothetical protein
VPKRPLLPLLVREWLVRIVAGSPGATQGSAIEVTLAGGGAQFGLGPTGPTGGVPA